MKEVKTKRGRKPLSSSGAKQQKQFRIAPDVIKALQTASAETGTPMSVIIENLVREYL